MQILIDELPKSCVGCKYFAEHRRQCNLELCLQWNEVKFKFNDCPLKSLHEYKKELVAKVCEKIRNHFALHTYASIDEQNIYEILDQIAKEFEDGE